jgi:hypothetical protein
VNTNILKKFAREARVKLMAQVRTRLNYILTNDSPELRARAAQVNELRQQIRETSQEEVVEKVAYTWFNRIMALRFMDANGYNNPKIVSSQEGYSLPELLQEAKAGNIDDGLQLDHARLTALLNSDAQNDAYRMLLVSACNSLYPVMPFMFERINDYTELLLPDDLLSEESIVYFIREGMCEDDCRQEEIIGWLYQFYISEIKDRVIMAKKRYKANEIAPASQLFTPHWMVKYIVDNTLGQMWLEANPSSNLKQSMEFYIEPTDKDKIPARSFTSPEEITFCDPCAGSGHILVYAFDLFTKIYEEKGYPTHEIPALILSKNLYGLEIDERAASLASFALVMRARKYYSRFFKKSVQPNIHAFKDIAENKKFANATLIGSLIRVNEQELDSITVEKNTVFEEQQEYLKKQAEVLARKYDCVVTNPPYINSTYMEPKLKLFVEQNYTSTKSDLFASFILRCLELTDENGMLGFVTPYVWMSIQSYES